VAVSSQPPPASITEQQALELINRWLQAKADIFAPPFDQQQALDLTSGELLASLLKPEGVLTWLKNNRAYYRYGAQKVDSVERFVATRSRATMELKMTEDRTLYLNGVIAPEQTDFSVQKIRFSLELVEGIWKIADYKRTDGFLLERSLLLGKANSTKP
jgi:serine/threonine-protein kinase